MYCYQLHHDGYFQDGILIFAFRGFQSKDVPKLLSSIHGSPPTTHPGCQSAPGLFPSLSLFFRLPTPKKNLHFPLLMGWVFLLRSLRWIREFFENVPPKNPPRHAFLPFFQPLPRHKASYEPGDFIPVGDPYISLFESRIVSG